MPDKIGHKSTIYAEIIDSYKNNNYRFLKKSIYFRQFLYNFAQIIDKEFKIMKKSLGIIILLFVFTLYLSAQQQIENIKFMVDNAETMRVLEKIFGVPYLLSNEKAIYKNVAFDGEKYNEAECFFNKDGKFNQLRLTTYCKSKDNAITRMNSLSKKYEGRYNITNSENLDDGKFVVGYNSKNRTMIMISTYKNNCDVSFSLF